MAKRNFIVEIDEEFCKGCNLCVEFCPKNVFTTSERLTKRGYFVPEVVNPSACTGCLLCEHLCPDMAITIRTKRTRKAKTASKN